MENYGKGLTNIHGKVYAMNAITPIPWWKSWFPRLVFLILKIFPSATNALVNLSFIHFARWVIVKRNQFPKVTPDQRKENLKYHYMFFFSNFNGTWNEYIDAFSSVLSGGLDLIWNTSVKYPGSRPVTGFKRYIALVQFDTDYYYSAYPYASINDVKAAHNVNQQLEAFAGKCANMDPAEFSKAYRQLLLSVQSDLGGLGQAPMGT